MVNKLCAWRHDMPAPLLPRGRPSASNAAEQTQRSSSFPRPIRSRGHRCICLIRLRWVKRPGDLDLWPFDHKSDVRVTRDVGYLCTNFRLPRSLCSRLRPDVRDRQTDVRQKNRLMPRLLGAGYNKDAYTSSRWHYPCWHRELTRHRQTSKRSDAKRYILARQSLAMGSAGRPEIGRQLGLRRRTGRIYPISGRDLSCLQCLKSGVVSEFGRCPWRS